jgi:uncharacterized membrane protein
MEFLIGLAQSWVLQKAKDSPAVSWLTPERITLIRALLMVLSVISGAVLAYLAGPDEFSKYDWKTAFHILQESTTVLLSSLVAYHGLLKKEAK